jgi:hypothetical protein
MSSFVRSHEGSHIIHINGSYHNWPSTSNLLEEVLLGCQFKDFFCKGSITSTKKYDQ